MVFQEVVVPVADESEAGLGDRDGEDFGPRKTRRACN